jgi:hypothetical protein
LKNPLNIIFSNKSLIFVAALGLLLAGSFANSLFVIAPVAYLATLALAYGIGGRISNHGLNVAYNWSVKWALFIAFLYLTSLFLKDAFVYAMFSFIFINIILNPMLFISQDEATT